MDIDNKKKKSVFKQTLSASGSEQNKEQCRPGNACSIFFTLGRDVFPSFLHIFGAMK